jgi:hypothetical protein
MSNPSARHPFLDDLAEDVTLVSSILREPVHGRALVTAIVKAGGSQYRDQVPQFLGHIDDRTFFEYTVTLHSGVAATGLVSIQRDGTKAVTGLNITFSPLGAVLEMSAGVAQTLDGQFAPSLFL